MKSCVVALAKYESPYIKEWVDHQIQLGFDHIIIGDNNNDYRENLMYVLNDYVCDNKVTIINIQNPNINQLNFYKHVYENLVGKYDWVLFCDIDEFLYLNNYDNVNDYLNSDSFNNFDVIKINWKLMSNNGYLIEIFKPVKERFTEEIKDCEFIDGNINDDNIYVNNSVKSFYRTNLNIIPQVHCTECYYENIRYCDCEGNEIIDQENFPNWSQYNKVINYSEAYIKHFVTKSLEEYVKYKMKRGWSCYNDTEERKQEVKDKYLNYEQFMKVNKLDPNNEVYKTLFEEFYKKYIINNFYN